MGEAIVVNVVIGGGGVVAVVVAEELEVGGEGEAEGVSVT